MSARFGLGVLAAAGLVFAGTAFVGAQPNAGLADAAGFAQIANRDERSVALFNEMGKVLTHPRCVNCHPRTDTPLQGDTGQRHEPVVFRGKDGAGVPGLECATCHGPANVAFANGTGSIPGDPKWHLAPASMAWEGKSVGDICRQLKDRTRNGGKTLAQIAEHNAHDHLVGWGWNPGKGRQPAPGTQARFGDLTKAWIAAGAKCPA
ncbi:MAG: Isoquinoline 1-oxidoreductase subunit [Pseudomonadota bacterium]